MEEKLQIFHDKFCTMQRRMKDNDEVKEEEGCQLKDQKLNVNAPVMMEASYSTHICAHARAHVHTHTHMPMAAWPSHKHNQKL
jgi:hypothetical protein